MSCINLLIPLKQRGPTKGSLLKGVFIPKLLNNLLASCSLINLDSLLSHTAHFDKSIILFFFVLTTFGFLLSVFFLLSYCHILFAHYLLNQIHQD